MSGYYDANGNDIFKDAATAFSKVVSTLTTTSGDATGFFEDAGTKYIMYQDTNSKFKGKWANTEITLPSSYTPKPTEIQLAKKGSCPIPAYPSSELDNGILYTNDTSLSETLYYFLAKNPETKCLCSFTMMETALTEKYNTSDKRKEFFDPSKPENRKPYWKDIPNTDHVKVIIIHLIGPGGDGGSMYSGGKAGGGGASGPAYSVIYDGLGYSNKNYEVFKITTDKTCWFSAEQSGSASFNPVDYDQREGDQWTKLVKVAKKGEAGGKAWTDAPYGKGGKASSDSPSVWASSVTNWGSKFDENHCIRLKPIFAGRSGYDAGSNYQNAFNNGTTAISLGYADICDPISVSIPTNYRTSGSNTYGYAGNGGVPAIHLRKYKTSAWPDLGVGGRGAYKTDSGDVRQETKGTIGGVIIEYEV